MTDKSKFKAVTNLDWLIFLGGYQGELDIQAQGKNSGTKRKNSNFGFIFTSKYLITNCCTVLLKHAETGVYTHRV